MHVGIKIGALDGIEILQKTKAKYCEVYFRLDWQEKYTPLFKYLKNNKINFGLHYWDMINGKYMPNLLYLNNNFAQKTYKSIITTFNIASLWGAFYLNFHPESYRQNILDLDKKIIKTIYEKKSINYQASFDQLKIYLNKINQYGKAKNVLALLETVPKYIVSDFGDIEKGRRDPQKSEGLETEKYFELAKRGQLITLDLGHTMSQYTTENRDKLLQYLYQTADILKDNIKLIHVTTNRPPFTDGVDSHNGILAIDMQQNVAPDQEQLIRLLSIFKDKEDVWLIPEPPQTEMIENYLTLKQLVKDIEG